MPFCKLQSCSCLYALVIYLDSLCFSKFVIS